MTREKFGEYNKNHDSIVDDVYNLFGELRHNFIEMVKEHGRFDFSDDTIWLPIEEDYEDIPVSAIQYADRDVVFETADEGIYQLKDVPSENLLSVLGITLDYIDEYLDDL